MDQQNAFKMQLLLTYCDSATDLLEWLIDINRITGPELQTAFKRQLLKLMEAIWLHIRNDAEFLDVLENSTYGNEHEQWQYWRPQPPVTSPVRPLPPRPADMPEDQGRSPRRFPFMARVLRMFGERPDEARIARVAERFVGDRDLQHALHEELFDFSLMLDESDDSVGSAGRNILEQLNRMEMSMEEVLQRMQRAAGDGFGGSP